MESTSWFGAVGLSAEDTRLYEALLDCPGLSASELAHHTRLAAATLRKRLRSLEDHGMVRRSPGPVSRFFPARPDVAIAALVARKQGELQRVRLVTEELLERYERNAGAREETDLVEIIEGREAFSQRYLQMRVATEREWAAFDKPPYVVPSNDCAPASIDTARRGITTRAIFDRTAIERPGRLEGLDTFVRLGGQVRVLRGVPLKLAISDAEVAFVTLDAAEGRERALVVHRSALLCALVSLFEALWEKATPLRLRRPVARDDSSSPSTADLRILEMLGAGFTDDTIARELRCSRRTVERRMRRLMHHLASQTRFQAGLEAAKRGWL